jgi:hypothetical protein
VCAVDASIGVEVAGTASDRFGCNIAAMIHRPRIAEIEIGTVSVNGPPAARGGCLVTEPGTPARRT